MPQHAACLAGRLHVHQALEAWLGNCGRIILLPRTPLPLDRRLIVCPCQQHLPCQQRTQDMGPNHPVVAISLQTLGHVLRLRQQLPEALEVAGRCERLRSSSSSQAQGPQMAAALYLQVCVLGAVRGSWWQVREWVNSFPSTGGTALALFGTAQHCSSSCSNQTGQLLVIVDVDAPPPSHLLD